MFKRRFACVLSILAVAAIAFGIVGCSGGQAPTSTPSGAVSGALDALKAQDAEALAQYYSGDVSGIGDPEAALEEADLSSLLGTDADLTDDQKAIVEDLSKKMLDFDYTVGNEAVDGDAATVDVTVTTYDFGTMIADFFSDYMSQAIAAAFSGGADEDALTAQAFDSLKASVDGLASKGKSATVQLGVTKGDDGTWKVDDISDNEEFADAILGGMMTSIEDLFSSLGDAFADYGADDDSQAAA